MKRPSVLAPALLALLTLQISAASAQDPEAQVPAAPDGSDIAASLQEFQKRLQAGDEAGAIAIMETLVQRPDAPPMARAILGGLYVDVGRTGEAFELLEPLAEAPDPDPAVLYNAGRAARAIGEIEKAQTYLERAVTLAPSSPAARELGLIRGLQGRYGDSYALLLPWVREHPDDFEARRAAALGAIQLQRVPEAERLLSDVPQDDPGVRLLWARLLLLKEDPWGAIGFLEPLAQEATGPMQRDALRSLAEAYLQVGESASAIRALEGHSQNDPTLALRLSQAYYQNGALDQALTTLEPFSRQVLENEEGRRYLDTWLVEELTLEFGRLLVAASRPTEAIPYLELATQAGPDNKVAWQTLGQALAATGERDRAQEALARFQELSEREERVGINQRERELADPTGRAIREAMELIASGDATSGLARLRREAELNPADPRPKIFEARSLLLLERPEEALAAGLRAVEATPDNADAHYVVGTALMALEKLDDAETQLRQTLELSPEHTAAMNDLAVLLMGKGEREEAARLLQRVLQLRPDDPVAKANLERILEQSQ